MKSKNIVTKNFYGEIKQILDKARSTTLRTVNFLMVESYWNIERLIVEEEFKGKNRADYGNFLVKELSEKLTKDFGKGFTETNVRYFKLFFLAFPIHHAVRDEFKTLGGSNLHALSGESVDLKNYLCPELSWTHYRILLN